MCHRNIPEHRHGAIKPTSMGTEPVRNESALVRSRGITLGRSTTPAVVAIAPSSPVLRAVVLWLRGLEDTP